MRILPYCRALIEGQISAFNYATTLVLIANGVVFWSAAPCPPIESKIVRREMASDCLGTGWWEFMSTSVFHM